MTPSNAKSQVVTKHGVYYSIYETWDIEKQYSGFLKSGGELFGFVSTEGTVFISAKENPILSVEPL
jgi:hypothetical protein